MKKKLKKKMSVVTFLSLGYIITIVLGTILLLLPIATKNGEPKTSIVDALVTATSATCVTGLVVFDTFTHWTLFGQIVILCLIQIGGLGFMTIITLIFMLFRKNLGLFQRTVLMQSAGSYNISGVVKLMKKILIGTLLFETVGAIILSYAFWGDFGTDAIYYGIFHSISAFCNAGFDLMGGFSGKFSSLSYYYNNPLVCLTITTLVIIGGLGFIVWSDLLENKFRFNKYQLHTKIVLVFNAIILAISTILYFGLEYNNPGTMADFTIGEKILNSFFMAVTPRTAGFNLINLNNLSEGSKLLTILLMLVGGNSGSTAGGMKVTTLVIVFANLIHTAKNKEDVVLFKRTISANIIKLASSLFLAYLFLAIGATLIICAIDPYSMADVLFEVSSGIGTVGLGLGITCSTLISGVTTSVLTKLIIAFLMYVGRIGAFTLFSLLVKEQKGITLKKPEGKVLVG